MLANLSRKARMPVLPIWGFAGSSGPGGRSGLPGPSLAGAGFSTCAGAACGPWAGPFGAAGAAGAGMGTGGGGRWKTTSSWGGGALRLCTCTGISSSRSTAARWSAMLVARPRGDGASEARKTVLRSTLVSTALTSIGREEFDPQIVDARPREVDDAQDRLVVH